MNDVKEWKWSLGEGYYKSARTKKPITEPNSNQVQNQESNSYDSYDSSRNAIKQSLAEDTDNMFSAYDFNDIMNDTMNDKNMISITDSMFSRNQNDSRREELDNKMSGRDLTLQRGTNPFMGQTSYVNDVVTRDMFLKPVNTTQGAKNKNKSEEQYFD